MMVDTFYLHLEFKAKSGDWSINLPFLCGKCGVCCTLDDFLTAGEISTKPEEQPEVQAKLKALYDKLGKLLEAGEAKYDDYTMHTPCPFLTNKTCSIYQIRPDGCRQFPNTTFGMQTQDCEALTRFKKQCATLKKGRTAKENYYFTGASKGATAIFQSLRPAKFTEKQYQVCIAKLRQAGITEDELTLFNCFNGHNHVL